MNPPRSSSPAFRLTLAAIFFCTAQVFAQADPGGLSIQNETVRVTVAPGSGAFSIAPVAALEPGKVCVISGKFGGAEGTGRTVKAAPATEPGFGEGSSIEVSGPEGLVGKIMVFPHLPFAMIRDHLQNPGKEAEVTNRVTAAEFTLDLGEPASALKTLGTGGLAAAEKNPGSYAWLAVAEPQSRHGFVGGWVTHERASGLLFPGVDNGKVVVQARSDYGRLRLDPGQGVETELLAIGYFADARLGLEAWADAVAKAGDIKLPPPPAGFCTWYAEKNGGSSNEKALTVLTDFASANLKPYGFNFVQIDDGWQLGEKKNGPKKNFTASNPAGPYPAGMQAMAEKIKAAGFTAGIWFMPFAGTYNDPWFAEHQDWFVKDETGKPYDNSWGGTSLDMTNPAARDYLQKIVSQIKGWGYRYFKMDGLYTGIAARAVYVNAGYKEDKFGDAVFFNPAKTNVEVFRDGLKLVRAAAGPEVFFLGCTAAQNMRTYEGSMGLVQGMRTGPDNNGSWSGWSKNSPMYGARHYFLNGRIWYNDADPYYVRAKLNLDQARTSASWAAISGQLSSDSDWLPDLPAERVEIIKRCLPVHGQIARPVDYFETNRPAAWTVRSRQANDPRTVVALYNWSDEEAVIEFPLARLDLPPAKEYAAFDFWANRFLPPLADKVQVKLPANGCQILAVRPMLEHPFVLSTSRHVTQGLIDVAGEAWDEAGRALSGRSKVVGSDPYELRISAGSAKALGMELSAEDVREGATVTFRQTGSEIRANIFAPASREVSWRIGFAAAGR